MLTMNDPNASTSLADVANSLISTLGAIEMTRLNNTPAIAQTPANPAPNVAAVKNNTMIYIGLGVAALGVLYLAMR